MSVFHFKLFLKQCQQHTQGNHTYILDARFSFNPFQGWILETRNFSSLFQSSEWFSKSSIISCLCLAEGSEYFLSFQQKSESVGLNKKWENWYNVYTPLKPQGGLAAAQMEILYSSNRTWMILQESWYSWPKSQLNISSTKRIGTVFSLSSSRIQFFS